MKKIELKNLIREMIDEIDFKNQDAFDAYKAKHKMRSSTKVNIGGKDTTVGQASKGGEKTGEDKNSKLLKKLSTMDVNDLSSDKREAIKKKLMPLAKKGNVVLNKLADYEDNMSDARNELYGVIDSSEVKKSIADKYGFEREWDGSIIFPKSFSSEKRQHLYDMEMYNKLKNLDADSKNEYADEISSFTKNLSQVEKIRKKYKNELDALDIVDSIR